MRYRYSRNGYDFKTAEYLEPTDAEPNIDTNDYFWTKHGRQITYTPGKIQKDEITRWRWFLENSHPLKTTNQTPNVNFAARVNNTKFKSGQTIEDLYAPAFFEFFNSTAKHLKEQGYTWVEIDPPWQWSEVNNSPKIVNDFKNNPNYPSDEVFLEELRAYKKTGLKVMITPQICCTSINTKNKPEEWQNAYFNEIEKFLLHFAELSQKENADAFAFAIGSWEFEDFQGVEFVQK